MNCFITVKLTLTTLCLLVLVGIVNMKAQIPPVEMNAKSLSDNKTTLLDNGSTNHGTVIIGGIHIHQK